MKLLYPIVSQLVILCIADLGLSLHPRPSRDDSDEICAQNCYGNFMSLNHFAYYDEDKGFCICRTIWGDINELNAVSNDLKRLEDFTIRAKECFKSDLNNVMAIFYDSKTPKFICIGNLDQIVVDKPLL